MSRMARSTRGSESLLRGLLTRVGKIGEQREVQIGIAIGQEADFEIVDQFAHLLFIQQQRRHGDERGEFRGNPVAEVELGQRLRIEEGRNGVVDQIDRSLRGWKQKKNDSRRQRRKARDGAENGKQRSSDEEES